MDALKPGLVKTVLWAVAVILFIIGGYSDTNTTEMWGWGFALLTAGFLSDYLLPLLGPPKREG